MSDARALSSLAQLRAANEAAVSRDSLAVSSRRLRRSEWLVHAVIYVLFHLNLTITPDRLGTMSRFRAWRCR